MDTVKLCWSGGKDSTCSGYKHLEQGNIVKMICYIPMFTNEIPLMLKCHYNFIMKQKKVFEEMGAEVHLVSGITYWEYCTHIAMRGKFKGKIFGFPCIKKGQCGFKRDSKIKAIREYDIGNYDYEDIGIAYDEIDQHAQLNNKKRSILYELKITENEAMRFCINKNAISPNYEKKKRDGCPLCPNAKESERQEWYRDYPEAIPLLKKLQRIVNEQRPEHKPLRGNKWFIPEKGLDGYQPTLFDFIKNE